MSYDKIQISISLKDSEHVKDISLLNVEVGYPDSSNNISWKSNARILVSEKFLDTMKQATWKSFDDQSETFVFDFLLSEAKQIVVRQTIINRKDNSMKTIENKIDIENEITSLEFISIHILKTNI